MPLECLAQKALGRSQIAPLAEPKLNRVAVAADGPVHVHPPSTDLDVSLVHVPFPREALLRRLNSSSRSEAL